MCVVCNTKINIIVQLFILFVAMYVRFRFVKNLLEMKQKVKLVFFSERYSARDLS